MRRRMGKADEHRAAADAIRFALRKNLGTIGIGQNEAPASCGMISISTLSGIAKKNFSSGRDSPGILCRREIRDGGFLSQRAFEIQ